MKALTPIIGMTLTFLSDLLQSHQTSAFVLLCQNSRLSLLVALLIYAEKLLAGLKSTYMYAALCFEMPCM